MNKLFAAVITDVTLDPQATHTFTGTWDWVDTGGTTVPAGHYEAWGFWSTAPVAGLQLTAADTRSPRVAFRVN